VALAGTNHGGFAGDNLPAIDAQLSGPQGVTFNSHGDLYVADTENQRVRVIPRLAPPG
jgi:DNA-binding beta-propeller fold protein YncE